MPYVKRDAAGQIIAIYRNNPGADAEVAAADDPELLRLLTGTADGAPQEASALMRADLEFIRVLEDLIDVLLKRDVIAFTDLPQEARRKVLSRQAMRSRLQGLSGLVEAEDDVDSGPF